MGGGAKEMKENIITLDSPLMTRKEINARAKVKVKEEKNPVDWFLLLEPVFDRITKVILIGSILFILSHLLVWVLK